MFAELDTWRRVVRMSSMRDWALALPSRGRFTFTTLLAFEAVDRPLPWSTWTTTTARRSSAGSAMRTASRSASRRRSG
jgi:hypothetical protein